MCRAALKYVNGYLVVCVVSLALCVYVFMFGTWVFGVTKTKKNKCLELVTKVENREDGVWYGTRQELDSEQRMADICNIWLVGV